MPSRIPPDRPDLAQKKKLSRELLNAVRARDRRQAMRFRWTTPRFRGNSADQVLASELKLADAQHVVAVESGFDSWQKMVGYIDRVHADPESPEALFESCVHAIIRGRVSELKALLAAHPGLATARSSRQHSAVLPHYLAANGVEDEHQIIPPNVVEVAEVLFRAGADAVVDAVCGAYGGGSASTPLVALVTSAHPATAGVQGDLVRVFCAAGAAVEGLDDDGLPMRSALGFRHPAAARALRAAGARADSLPVAAALGEIDLVREMLEGARSSAACHLQNPDLALEASSAPHPDPTLAQAFVLACMAGELQVAELLLDRGVPINAAPRAGVTALHESAMQGDPRVVRFLLDRGADPSLEDGYWGSTPLEWARGNGQAAVVEELQRGQGG